MSTLGKKDLYNLKGISILVWFKTIKIFKPWLEKNFKSREFSKIKGVVYLMNYKF